MDDEGAENAVSPPHSAEPTSVDAPQGRPRPGGNSWPYLGGLILSIGVGYLTYQGLHGSCQNTNILVIAAILTSLAWSISDIRRGRAADSSLSVLFGVSGVVISLCATSEVIINLTCVN